MRRIVMFLAGTASALVLLFGYHTSTAGSMPAASPSSGVSPLTATSGNTAGGGTSAGGAAGGDAGGDTAGTRTVTGPAVPTEWGPVQVQLTLTGDRITDVTVLQYPHDNDRDLEINSYALPILVQDTLDAQSAEIDMVSGATVTSVGYLRSLQAALDQARL